MHSFLTVTVHCIGSLSLHVLSFRVGSSASRQVSLLRQNLLLAVRKSFCCYCTLQWLMPACAFMPSLLARIPSSVGRTFAVTVHCIGLCLHVLSFLLHSLFCRKSFCCDCTLHRLMPACAITVTVHCIGSLSLHVLSFRMGSSASRQASLLRRKR